MIQSVRSQLLQGVAWNFTEKVMLRGISFMIGIILARLLTPSDYGLIGLLAVFMALSNAFIDGGFSKALVQRQNCNAIDYSTTFVSNMVMSLFLFVILYIFAPWIALFYEEPILTDLTRVLSFNIVLGAINIVQRSMLMSKVDFKSLAIVNVLSTIISGIIGVGMAYLGYGVWSLVGMTLANTMVCVVVFPFFSKWKISLKFSKASFQNLFGFGSKLMITSVVSVIMNNISTIFIGKFYRSSQLGYFTRASQYPDMIYILLYEVIGNVTFPVLSHLQNDKEKLLSVYKKSLYMTAFLVIPIMVLGTLLARPLIVALITEKWLPCVILMQWLLMARIVSPISAINLNALNALGRSDLFMKVDFSKIPMNLIMLTITIPIGVEAITIGMFCTSWIAFFVNAYYPGRLFGYGGWSQLKDWRYIILSVLIMCPVVILVVHVINNVWLQLILGGMAGLITYILCCYIFKVIDDEMLVLLKLKKNG